MSKLYIVTWYVGGDWLTDGRMRGEMKRVVTFTRDEAEKKAEELNLLYPHIFHSIAPVTSDNPDLEH